VCVCVCVCVYICICFHGSLCLLRMYLCDDVLTWGAEVLQDMYCALIWSWN